jgi:predicted permease
VAGVGTTPSLFSTLGVEAALGRTFTADEAVLGNERVVLLSDGLWRSHFGADRALVGRDIRISGQPYRVVGVMPASFAFPRREVALWVPFAWTERQQSDAMRGFEFAQSIGRLRANASLDELNAQLDALVANNLERFAGTQLAPNFVEGARRGGFVSRARSLHAHLVGDLGATLWLLQGAVVLLLLIACANVANLLLMRFSARRGELAMRVALGASRWRLARQILTESALLALAGAVVGVAVTSAGVGVLRVLGLNGDEHGLAIGINARVLGFALVAALLSLLLCALPPLLALGRDGALSLAGRNGIGGGASRRQRSLLVVLQLSLAIGLLAGTGLLGHSIWRLQQVDPGFNPNQLYTVSINLSRERYRELAQTRAFNEQLVTAVAAIEGVAAVGAIAQLPFSADYGSAPYFVEGDESTESVVGTLQVADSGYFRSMQIPLLRGRLFEATDRDDSLPVVVIDQALVERSFAGRDPLGHRIGTAGVDGALHWRTVVGVVQSVKTRQLSERDGAPTFYSPLAQQPARIFRLVMRTPMSLDAVAASVREAVASVDPEQPLWELMRMQDRIERSLDVRRTPVTLLVMFAGVALLLSAVGIYAVLAHSVGQRSAEIGLRMAVGASRAAIMRWVLIDGCRLLLVGSVFGSLLAVLLGMQLRAQLFEVSPLDPLTLLPVLLVVACVTVSACWIPALRAAAITPMEAMRRE